MKPLIRKQNKKLDEVLKEVASLPAPEMIAESIRLRCPGLPNEPQKAQFRMAARGGYAAEKVLLYLDALRLVDKLRLNQGKQGNMRANRARKYDQIDAEQYAYHHLMAVEAAGRQEVTYHFFAICVAQINRLLPEAARAAGYKIPLRDRRILDPFVDLRDYFKHLEQRLPGKSRQAAVVTEIDTDDEWSVWLSLKLDEQGRIVLDGQPIDVTTRGLQAVEGVVQRTWENICR
jgi:hypothetical protein